MLFEDIRFNNSLFNEDEALLLGNCFKNEYVPYKDYKNTGISIDNDKDNLMLNIYKLDFYINDLSLYLDLHPNDKYMYSIFKDSVNSLNHYIDLYESNYGPLELCKVRYDNYLWNKGNIPFGGTNV